MMKQRGHNYIFIIVALFWFAQYIYMPFFSPFLALIDVPASIIGVIAGSYGFTQMALRMPLSIFGSIKGNHKAIIGGGLVIVLLSCSMPLLSHSWVSFLLTRALAGVASSTWVSYSAYLLEDAGPMAKQRMGYLMAANTGGICISQITGTVFFNFGGLNTLFVIAIFAAAAGVVLLGFTSFTHRGAANAPRPAFTKRSLIETLTNRNLWFCSMLMLLAQWVLVSSNFTFTGIFAQEALRADALHLGLIALVFQVSSTATSILFGKFGGRDLPEKPLLISAFSLAAFCCAAITFCNLAALIVMQAIYGVAKSAIGVILFARAGRNLSDDQQLLSMGFFQSVYGIGMTVGPAVTGFVFERSGGNFALIFYALAAVAVIGAVCTAFSGPRAPRIPASGRV